MKPLKSIITITLFSLLFSVNLIAQASGSLTGVVKDQNDAVIPGATVTIRNTGTNLVRTVVTNDEGRWTMTVLPTGSYSLEIEKEGFKKSVSSSVEVESSVTRTVDITLEAGLTDVTVNVTTDLPLVQSESAATARQITGDQLIRTPTSTRSFTGLLASEAGVSSELSPVGVNGNGNVSPSVNGTRTTSTSLFFNGIDATNITSNEGSLSDNISPAPETLQEVKLQTSLYDASTGRSGGGNFQLVTKAGGNRLGGSVYYYLQNKAFNSNEFFLKEAGVEKPKADRAEAGFTLGGPVIKDRFFFFGGYQFTDANTGLVPTARTRTILPRALTVLGADRSKEAIAAAFNQFNGCSGATCLTPADISDVAFNIFNLQNPVTGGFVLPYVPDARRLFQTNGSPLLDQSGNGTFQFGMFPAITPRTLARSNELVEFVNVQPSKFRQHQATLRLDSQLSDSNTLS